ncbi:MAG: ATP-grasp domain-containing protein [Bacteroidales bacterium]|nr:ATP-grasp domain-containing protein [Bacteroidales bacterium]
MTSKKIINIGVTGLNAIDSPGPGVSVIRGLREAKAFDVRIIGLSYESLEPGIYMHDIADKSYQIPYPSSGTATLLERLKYIQEKEKLDMIIPNFDAELFPFMKLSDELDKLGIKTFLPTFKQYEEREKYNLPDFGEKYGFNVPASEAVHDIAGLQKLASKYDYPVVVKGKFYDAGIAYNLEQAKSYFHKISAKWGLPIIVQEFIDGTEFNVTGLGDGKGNTISAVPMRKQYITDKGKAWGGISISDKQMLDLTDKFISSTKWKGGFELEFMKNKDGEFYILEINPRLPAWVYLAIGVGQNIPEALVKLAMGMDIEPFRDYDVGKMFIRYSWDMMVDLKDFQQISTFGEL